MSTWNTYDKSVWFRLFCDKLKKDFKSISQLNIDPSLSHACVAAIIRLNPQYPSNENLDPFDLLYIRRALKKNDPWSGQIAFPGGRHENNETLQETAERETMEEIGLDITKKTGNYQCIGYCHKMDITRGKYKLRVICFVYLQIIESTPKLKLEKNEVDNVAWINIAQLIQSQLNINQGMIKWKKLNKCINKKNKTEKGGFYSRYSKSWSNMMIDPLLNEKIVLIYDKFNGYNHVNLFLEFQHKFIPINRFKYPGIILRTEINDNDYWLLWGLTYRMTGYLLSAMHCNHYLRYKHISKGSYKLGHHIMYLARYFYLDLKWRSSGIEPYFVEKLNSKL